MALALLALALFMPLTRAAKTTPPPPSPVPPPISTPHYFFTIDLDPRYQVVGTGALTEDEAAKAACYRFTYGPAGKLTQVEYRRAGTPMPDPLFGVASIAFEYQPGLERRWFRNAQGQPAKDAFGIQGEELKLNAAGFPTEITNLDASGAKTRDTNGVVRYVRTLDNLNRAIMGRRIGLFGTDITDDAGYFETRKNYDNQSQLIEYSNYDASGNLLNNSDGVAIVRTTYTIYPDATEIARSFFDATGLATVEKSSGVHELQQMVDHRGFVLSEAYFDTTGAPCLDTQDEVHERRYTYDDRGNRTSESFFDTDGKPIDTKRYGFARIVYSYDDQDRIVEKSFFGADGAPQIAPNLGAAVVRQEYDEQGSIVHQQFFDGQGHPCDSARYGAAAIRIKVDGDRTLVSLRDAKDRPAKNPLGGYFAFSYKTDSEKPLAATNLYYDKNGRELSFFPRVSVINPHLYAMRGNLVMQNSARYGALAVALGALLAAFLALRKSSHTRRRKVYVPTPVERLLGWFAIFAIIEGTLRFFLTVYWSWLDHQYARMGHTIYVVETIIVLFFLYRLLRLRVTMRVLNIEREDIHRIVRNFFAKANLKPAWLERRSVYSTPPLDVRVNFFQQKYHAYLAFRRRAREGRDLARALAQYIRVEVREIKAPVRSRAIALYYPVVAFGYLLLSGTAIYTLWQLIKSY